MHAAQKGYNQLVIQPVLPKIRSQFTMSPSASLGAGKRPLTVPWRYKVGGLFRVLPRQWNRLDRHGTDIEASQNKANCSGICHYQIRTYDERVRSPTRALMAAGTPEISTFLYQTPVQ